MRPSFIVVLIFHVCIFFLPSLLAAPIPHMRISSTGSHPSGQDYFPQPQKSVGSKFSSAQLIASAKLQPALKAPQYASGKLI